MFISTRELGKAKEWKNGERRYEGGGVRKQQKNENKWEQVKGKSKGMERKDSFVVLSFYYPLKKIQRMSLALIFFIWRLTTPNGVHACMFSIVYKSSEQNTDSSTSFFIFFIFFLLNIRIGYIQGNPPNENIPFQKGKQ